MLLLLACVTQSEAVLSTMRMGFHQLLLLLMKLVMCKSNFLPTKYGAASPTCFKWFNFNVYMKAILILFSFPWNASVV